LHYHDPKKISERKIQSIFWAEICQSWHILRGKKVLLATQIWLIPLADDQESTYFTKLKRKKKNHSSHQLNIATQNVVVVELL
jgi:hypothetical protein